jgi:formate C-acetyltransferase
MYELKPVTDRVLKMRDRYRDTKPEVCTARYRLVTEFYRENPDMTGILKRAKNFRNICEKLPIRIDEGEVIVGSQSARYRAPALYPENSVSWLKEEIMSGRLWERDLDPYTMSGEDRDYVLSTVDFWMKECMSAKTDAQIVDEYFPHVGNGVAMFAAKGQTPQPVGHFCSGFENALKNGFGAIKEEAEKRKAEIVEAGIPADSIEQYNYYRATAIVCEGMVFFARRHAALALELAASEQDPARKKELEMMADTLGHCMEKPARNFMDAVQAVYMYMACMCLDACMHGISFGRIDQYFGGYYEADLAAGLITPEYAQEIMDLFYLKTAEMNKIWSYEATKANPGYTNGMLMTLGGVKKDGSDATNTVTYMMLQTSGRLVLHDPPQALRIHKGTPRELWEAAIETTKIAGGVPTFENDDVIIPALLKRGLPLESARNNCLIGCVEPTGCGDEWASPGGTGTESFMNIANALLLAINDGYNPMLEAKHPKDENKPAKLPGRVGLPTGYLYNMGSIEEVQAAYRRQLEYFTKWQAMNINSFEYVAREVLPLPVASAAFEGCMEKGADVMHGGARHNSTGMSGVGIGNVADSLNIIDHLCFKTKKCTTRELHDALSNNWEGYEDLRAYIQNEAPHYGNGIPEADKYVSWVGEIYANAVNNCTGPRGRYSAGLYPVTTNVMLGSLTAATPDGRRKGEPLADGISPVQQMDTNGPTAILVSVSKIDQSVYGNGTLLNMKFHPTALKGEDGFVKLSELIKAYFAMGGMEMQINVVSAATLRDAQENPENHRNLVVRVAGFSAYFVELHVDGQEDLIRRTELAI